LPERERTILTLRFYEGLTQSQIAERLGLSQVHVGRLLTATLATLRDQLDDDSLTNLQS
jgi:RNA polymerase sigma-B factor